MLTTIEIISIAYNLFLLIGALAYFSVLRKFDHSFSLEGISAFAATALHFFIIVKIITPEILPFVKAISSPMLNLFTMSFWISCPIRQFLYMHREYKATIARDQRLAAFRRR